MKSIPKIPVWQDSELTTVSNVIVCRRSFYFRKPALEIWLYIPHSSGTLRGRLGVEWSAKTSTSHSCIGSFRTDSEEVARFTRDTIQECKQHHEHCKQEFVNEQSKRFLPLRFVDVKGYQNGFIDIVSTTNISPGVEYLALSHCWGGRVNLKLTKATATDSRVSLTVLPSTFRDAVDITCKLGARYIWIDSLCIVQDDLDEWAAQSVDMGLVYANAKCVISATASGNPGGGCYYPRDLWRNPMVLLEKGALQLTIHREARLLDLFIEKVSMSPIRRRGWTLQEHFLANRTLHFVAGCVLFECNEFITSDHALRQTRYPHEPRRVIRVDGKHHPEEESNTAESDLQGPDNLSENVFTDPELKKAVQAYVWQQYITTNLLQSSARLGDRGEFDFLWRFSGTELDEIIEFHKSWFEIITAYSRRSLTRHEDKLMALSGIASVIQQKAKLVYNSGLWHDLMPLNLLWTVAGKLEPRPRRPIPSWSWASTDGIILNRLTEASPPGLKQFRSQWTELTLLVDNQIELLTTTKVNGLVMNSRIVITGHLWPFDTPFTMLWDVLDVPVVDSTIAIIPILAFTNAQIHPVNSKRQVHGIVVHQLASGCFERLGYFWTARRAIIRVYLEGLDPKSRRKMTLV